MDIRTQEMSQPSAAQDSLAQCNLRWFFFELKENSIWKLSKALIPKLRGALVLSTQQVRDGPEQEKFGSRGPQQAKDPGLEGE